LKLQTNYFFENHTKNKHIIMSKSTSYCCLAVAFLFFHCTLFGQTNSMPEPYLRYQKEETKGNTLFGQSKYELAIAQYQRAQLLSDSLENFVPIPSDTLKKWQFSTPPQRRLNLLSNTNACKAQLGRFEESLSILVNEIIPLAKELSSPNLLAFLSNAGGSYDDIGQLEKGLPYHLEAIKTFDNKNKKNQTDSVRYASVLSNIGYNYERQHRTSESLPFYRAALQLRRQQKDAWRLGYGLMKLGYAHFLLNKEDSAYLLLKESLTIADTSKTWREHADFGITTHYFGEYLEKNGQIDLANNYFQKAFDIHRKQYGLNHNRTLRSMMMSGLTLAKLQKTTQAHDRLQLFNQTRNEYNNRNFAFLNESARDAFLESVQFEFNDIQSIGLDKRQSDALSDVMFDNTLLYKGMLLQQSRLSSEALKRVGDSSVLRKVEQLNNLKKQLEREQSRPLSTRSPKLDSLNQVVQTLESQLQHQNRQANSIQQFSWKEAKRLLQDTVACVEFVHFMAKDSQIWYGAYVLRSHFERPQWVLLFKENRLENLLKSNGNSPQMVANFYASRGIEPVNNAPNLTANLYELIWSPLDTFLRGAKQVYYAPSGLLHRLSMEAIPLSKGGILSDSFDLAYINSARSLLIINQLNKKVVLSDAVVFGGVDYDTEGVNGVNKNDLAMRSPSFTRGTTATWNYLDGTLQEAQVVDSILKKAQIATTILTKKMASEESLKALGGGLPSPSIIHIATHGYFFNQTVDTTENNAFMRSSQPLMRSGLILAGGNKTWQGKMPAEGHEDGVVTAYEISHLNFKNTQLAVLSACETGLGDIRSSEGVFGLQRAFKMAGVRYLLVSLWSVPDAPTAQLMQFFYENLVKDNNVRKAFKDARQSMRDLNPNSPLNWAGFVLME
jgi:CHAT domain-containing protein/tetratricopeptide (TPR) repeat protein